MAALSMDKTFGAILVGGTVNAILYGVTSVQSYLYYVNYPKDVKGLKFLVGVIWVLDTVHVAIVTLCIYHYVITNFFEPLALTKVHWSLAASVFLNVSLAAFVQVFFTIQIHTVSKAVRSGRILISVLVMLVTTHIVFGLETAVWLLTNPTFEELANSNVIKLGSLIPMAVCAVLADVLLAGSLCVLLHRSRTHISGSNTIINSLMTYAINRCILTSVVTLTELILFTAWPNEFWFLALDIFTGKLWANSLLASLNSRNHLRDQQDISVMNASLNFSVGAGGGSSLAMNTPIENNTVNDTRLALTEEGVYALRGNNVDVDRAWKSVGTPEVQIRVPADRTRTV
ncbi:hypothetical protein V5O48_010036 [Marasmius crinis-equi]|uniref:DUF6534 domain-containing protein n=1 Tax=Marasmius crinis-equi TaxID=585013 RepID=A0ABR3FA00_9AGAR